MKIAVIGAGNMGSAIVRGICSSANDYHVGVSDPHDNGLNTLKSQFPGLQTTHDNKELVCDAQVVIIAVKPWIFKSVAEEIANHLKPETIVVSIVAGVTLEEITMNVCNGVLPAARVIPDTAISVGAGMTFICTARCDDAQRAIVQDIFGTMGGTQIVEERLMGACTVLSSCGIAYVYKFIQAYVQAGVEMGMYPKDALNATLATIEGAVKMMQQPGATVQGEIDRVTTPGGMTIRGINELEHQGFTSAVINAIKKPLQK